MTNLDITYVSKECNPPNALQMRPVEDFFGILKQEVYRGGWRASNHKQLQRRIKYCLYYKVDKVAVCNMMNNVFEHIKKAYLNFEWN